MKKILNYSYSIVMFIFLALYTVLLRKNANNSLMAYCIGMILGSIFVFLIAFFINKCKKVIVRNIYLGLILSISLTLISYTITYLDYSNALVTIVRVAMNIFTALNIVLFVLLVYYSIKDWFRKGYQFEKFDLQSIKMMLNSITYYMFVYYLNVAYAPNPIIDANTMKQTLEFEYNNCALAILYTSLAYIVISIILELIYHHIFVKNYPNEM